MYLVWHFLTFCLTSHFVFWFLSTFCFTGVLFFWHSVFLISCFSDIWFSWHFVFLKFKLKFFYLTFCFSDVIWNFCFSDILPRWEDSVSSTCLLKMAWFVLRRRRPWPCARRRWRKKRKPLFFKRRPFVGIYNFFWGRRPAVRHFWKIQNSLIFWLNLTIPSPLDASKQTGPSSPHAAEETRGFFSPFSFFLAL